MMQTLRVAQEIRVSGKRGGITTAVPRGGFEMWELLGSALGSIVRTRLDSLV